MQDGQFAIPNTTIGQPTITPKQIGNTSPEYRPIEYVPYIPAQVPGTGGLQTNPELYDDIKIANQSGLTNWWNSLVNSWNETQIGVGGSDLMDGLTKKARTQKKLNQLEADFSVGDIKEIDYLNKKNDLYDDLGSAYSTISSARSSMYEDQGDKNTLSKAFQFKSNLINAQGSNASLLDQIKYQWPNALGSSLSLIGPSIMGAFGQKAIQTAVARGLASAAFGSELPGLGNAIGFVVGAGATVASNLLTRNLESKAEVGSQFLQDYDNLKSNFLKDKPEGYEISENEDNDLILQAAKGADTQYNKNMTLALSDTLQSMIFAGSFNKVLSKFRDINKLTRLATFAGEYYTAKKLEGLEEGLQYVWSTEKSLASLGLENTQPFFSSLVQDYKDVIGSMQFLGQTAGGIYSDDDQFNASVHAGEMLGGLFAGVNSAVRIGKDVGNYYTTTRELNALNPTKVDSPVLKFKDELYSNFFGPKKVGVLGVLNQDSDDRVFYFKEALKSLNKQRTEDGKPLLTDEELKNELTNIDEAYSTFKDVNENLDNILSPFGRQISRKTDLQKKTFRDELFHNTMNLMRLKGTIRDTESKMNQRLTPLNDISQVSAKLSVVQERLQNSTGNFAVYLNKEVKNLQDQLESVRETYTALQDKIPSKTSIDQPTAQAIELYYDAAETSFDYEDKRKKLAKVKSWKQLQDWAKVYEKTAPESYLKDQEEGMIEDNKEYADGQGARTSIDQLQPEDKAKRNKDNKDILNRAGFSKSYTDTLDENQLDIEAEKALEDFRNKIPTITEETILTLIYNSESKDELNSYLSRPSIRAAFNRAGFNINDDINILRDQAEKKLIALGEDRRANKVRKPRPPALETRISKDIVVNRVKDKADQRDVADYENQFTVQLSDQGKFSSQKDVLEAIINSKYSIESEKELARKLLTITTSETILFRENWRPKSKADSFTFDAKGQPQGQNSDDLIRRPATTAIHGDGTTDVIVDLGHFGDDIQGNQYENLAPSFEAIVLHELIHRYTGQALIKDPSLNAEVEVLLNKAKEKADQNYYGLTNVQEFVAEAMSSPDFQRFLANIEGTGNKTLWQQFVDAVGRILKSAFGIEIQGSLLEDVISLTSGIIEGKGKRVGAISFIESIKAEANTEFGKIDPAVKDAKDQMETLYMTFMDRINKTVNDNELGETVRADLIDTISNLGLDLERKIDQVRRDSKTFYFQGSKFTKGNYVVLKGYAETYWITGAGEVSLEVKTKDNNTSLFLQNPNIIEFQGNEQEAEYYLAERDKSDYKYNDSSDLYKSVEQEFEKKNGKLVENNDPIVKRFDAFVAFLNNRNLDKLPYRGLLVQDNDELAGFTIPRSQATKDLLASGGKEGQVVVVVDRDGNPVKFNNLMIPSEDGNYIVFNIELPKRILGRDTKSLADSKGISFKEAETLKIKVAQKISAARKSASEGKPVFIDFTGINTGENRVEVAKEIQTNPISDEDAARFVRLIDYFNLLNSPDNTLKEAIETTKNFLFESIIGKSDKNAYVSGGKIYKAGEWIISPSVADIIDNFDYKKSFDRINRNDITEILDVQNDSLVTIAIYPTYFEYLSIISDLGSEMTKARYNGYIKYEIAEAKGVSVKPENPEAKVSTLKEDPSLFNESNLFDASINPEKDSKFTNELGLFDNRTTFELIKSLDKGIHNYLRKTQTTTIVGALEDQDFLNKALDETRKNLIAKLYQLKDIRIAQLDSKSINQAWYENNAKGIDDKISKLETKWPEIAKYYFSNSYVFSYGKNLSYKYNESGESLESTEGSIARERGFDKIGNEVSPIDGASKEIKALIRGLSKFKKIDNRWQKVANSFNVPDLVNFAVTWNNLLKNLQGLSTFEEMLQKLDSLELRFPEYGELLEILRSYYAKARGGEVQSLIMIAKFNKDFINPEIPVIQNLISFENGTTFKIDEATRKNVKDLRKSALDNFRYKSPFAVKTTLGDVALSPKILQAPISTKTERIKFLEGLGFQFSEGTLKDPLFDQLASPQILRYFKDEILIIQQSKIIKDPIAELSKQTALTKGQSKRISDILDLESKYSESTPTLSMQNVEDNTEYAISRPNGYSTVIKALNDVNKYPDFQSLVSNSEFDWLNKPYARTSHILNMIFVLDSKENFGKRRKVRDKFITLELLNISGLKVEEATGKKTTSMFIGDKLVNDVNQLLKSGSKELTRAGDKNSSFGFKVSTFIQPTGSGILPISNFDLFKGVDGYGGEQFQKIMANYLKGEVSRIILARQGHLSNILKLMDKGKQSLGANTSLFASLLSDDIKAALYASIEALPSLEPNSDEFYYQAEVIANDYISRPTVMSGIRKFLYIEAKAKQESLSKYGFEFNDRFWLDKVFKDIDMGTILRSYIVNEFILHIEQTKLFNGDLAFYSTKDGEFHKRTPSTGATGIIPISDKWFVDAMNQNPLTNLQSKLLGLDNAYSNIIKTVVFEEHVPQSVYIDIWSKQLKENGISDSEIDRILAEYKGGSKEADAQGWITMDYYRSFKISIGDWRLEQEKVYERASKGEALSVEEVEGLGRLFPPVKAQYAGPVKNDVYHVPAFDKFSLMPLLPSAVRGTALEALNERMIRNNVSYSLMLSGSKVGVTGSKLESFYENRKTRSIKDPRTPFLNENFKFVQFLKEQVQLEPELHSEVIFGTQFRKLLFQNVYSNGEATNKKLALLENEYSKVIDEITNYEKDRLIEDMGVSPVMKDNKVVDYEVKNQTKLLDRIKTEISRRKLNNSIKDFFELENGQLRYPLDASINHQQVRTLILSMINNRLIRQTIKGDMMVQGSGLGYEKLTKPTDIDLLKYGTNGLRFYHIANGKVRKMQVKLPLTGDFKHLFNFSWNGTKIGTLETLNKALKDESWVESNTKALTMVGYRIPTQGLNSIEVMEVAEFLPPEAGNILIVPTEIVTKAGSDFDIDKLNVFKPSLYSKGGEGYYVNRTGYKGTKKSIKSSIDEELNQLINRKKSIEYFDSLPAERKNSFIQHLESELGLNNAEELGDLGISIQNLRDQILNSQASIDNLNNELRADLDPETHEELIAERARQMDLKIYLADELDRKQLLKDTGLVKAKETTPNAEQLLDALYESLILDQKEENEKINKQIRTLVDTRKTQLDEISNYKGGLFNAIIELATERLTDANSFAELITPNSTDLIKPKVQEIASKAKLIKKPYLHTNNLISSTQEEKFLAGIPNKQALGIAAVANTTSQLFNKVGLKINQFFNKREVFHPMVDNLNMSDKYLKNGILKSEIESQMINAYVDVLNDDFISKANLSLDTAGTFFYLLHLSHDSNQLMDFFNHPVIKAYVREIQKSKSIIIKANDLLKGRLENIERAQYGDAIIEDLDRYMSNRAKKQAFFNAIELTDSGTDLRKEGFRKEGLDIAKSNRNIFSVDNLSNSVSKQVKDIPEQERRAVLAYYLNVVEESAELLNLQLANNYDTTTSVNPVANEFREDIKTQLLEKSLFNTIDIASKTVIKPFNQFALVSKVLESIMPITLSEAVRNQIVGIVRDIRGVDQDKLTRTFINDWIQFLAFNLGETREGEKVGIWGKKNLIKSSVDNRLINTLLEFKLEEKWANLRIDYPIINNFRADIDGLVGNVSFYREDNSSEYQNTVIEQLQNLAEFKDITYSQDDQTIVRNLFKDLMLLGFVQSGLNKSPISFSDLIPNEYYAPMMTKALDKYKSLDKIRKDFLFYRFAAMFRTINTQIMGNKSNTIPYWRFKDYNLPEEAIQSQTMIQMQDKNIAKIEAGIKTTTTRSESQAKVINIPVGESKLVKFGSKLYTVKNRGLLSIKEAGGKQNILKSEGVSSEDEFSYQQTKDWINGKGKLYVYDISANIKGINIGSKSDDALGRALTNPTWGSNKDGKTYFDVESAYKATKSKNTNPTQALKEDMNTMYTLINKKLRQNPELIDEINSRGGLSFIEQSSHEIGVKGSRWEGKGLKSNFIKVLAQSYTTIAKELGKFIGSNVEKNDSIITRSIIKANPNKLFVFGDNNIRKGLGGQAKEARGEPNAYGISTKKIPSNAEDSFMTDSELEENKAIIRDDVNKIITAWKSGKYIKIVLPPIGTGMAKLPEKAPQTWAFLQSELSRLENTINNPTPEAGDQLAIFDASLDSDIPDWKYNSLIKTLTDYGIINRECK